MTEKTGKSLTIAVINKSTNKSIGQIEIAENPNNKTTIIVDGDNNIIGVSPATTPNGLNYGEKTGIVTSTDYTGAYPSGSYLIGDVLPSNLAAVDHSKATATIRAADYSTKLTTINATSVSSSVSDMLIVGNDNVKNVLTAPNAGTLNVKTGFDPLVDTPVLRTTLKGGLTQADVLNGSTLTGATDYFYVTPSTKGKKDTVINYDEHDWIIIEETQNIKNFNSLQTNAIATNAAIKFDDKSADAVLTLEKSVITIKDGAGKNLNLMLVDEDGNQQDTIAIGHILPKGLKYDSKKTSIAVKDNATTEAADVGGENARLGLDFNNNGAYSGYAGYVAVDLNDTLNYFSTVKTINLKKINNKIPTEDDATTISDNSVHVTLLGNSNANDFWAGGNQSSTTVFYGGAGDLNKPDADKFYGGAGRDILVYELGDGKDQFGDTKNGGTFTANDVIVLGSGGSSKLSKDNIFVTDSKNIVTIQLGTDTKKGTLTIVKDSVNTPLHILLSKDSNTALGVAYSVAGGKINTLKASDDFDVFEYGLSQESITAELNDKNLIVKGVNYDALVDSDGDPLEYELPLHADIVTKEISSAIKNVDVSANSELTVNVVGNNNANSITLGAGGGTVDGSYSRDTKGKYKATADVYYGGKGQDVFVYDTLVINGTDVGGKDVINNYDPGNDGIFINSLSDIKSLAYSDKSVTFTFSGAKSGSKNNTLTIKGPAANSGSLASDTQITFLVGSTDNAVTYTYFDKKETTDVSKLTLVQNPWTAYKRYNVNTGEGTAWTPSDDPEDLNVWNYTGNAWTKNGLNFTVRNIADHYGDTEATGHIDISTNFTGSRPVGITVDEPGGTTIVVDTVRSGEGKDAINKGMVDFTDFWFNSDTALGATGVHIKGLAPVYDTSTGIYDNTYIAMVNTKGLYRLANLDGIDDNGYELLKTNDYWDLTMSGKWQYHKDLEFTVNSGDTLLDVREWNDTIDNNSAYNAQHAGGLFDFFVEGHSMTVNSGINSAWVTFSSDTKVGTDDDAIHIVGFNTDTTFGLTSYDTKTKKSDTTVYILADLDGNRIPVGEDGETTVVDYEFLKVNDRWKLTPTSWDYSCGTTKFSVALSTPTIGANEDGSADGITVTRQASLTSGANATLSSTAFDTLAGYVVDFSDLELDENVLFYDSLVSFDAGITTGKYGVHVKGLDGVAKEQYDSQVTVGESAYWLVNLDGDRAYNDVRLYKSDASTAYSNGYELAKVNENWTPVFVEGKAFQDWAYEDDNVKFTITSAAVTVNASGLNTDGTIVKTFDIDDNGAVKNITVSDEGVIEFGSALTSRSTIKNGTANATLGAMIKAEEITFDSDTAVGTNGIHIKGFSADDVVRVRVNGENVAYQLANLDGNSSNGLELMEINSLWTFDNGKWTYDNGTYDAKSGKLTSEENEHLRFSFDSSSGLYPMSNGQASGISVVGSTITFNLSSSARDKALKSLRFYSIPKSTDEETKKTSYDLKMVGLAEDTKVTLFSNETIKTGEEYQVVNIVDDETEEGEDPTIAANTFELMKVDKNWTLKGGAWSYMNSSTTATSTFACTINSHASLVAGYDGTPQDVSYDTEEKTLSLHGEGAVNFIATDLTITQLTNKSNNSITGSNGLHIVLPTTEEVGEGDNASVPAGVLVADTRYKVGNDTYQLVNLDEDSENYELMKVNSNWTLAGDDWSYANGDLAFSIIRSNTEDNGVTTNIEDVFKPTDNGIPADISVVGSTMISVANSFSTDYLFAHFVFSKAKTGTVSGAVHFKGGTDLTESSDDYSFVQEVDEDTNETTTSLSELITIGGGSQTYRLIDLDGATNGLELMKVNDNWKYITDTTEDNTHGWEYVYGQTVNEEGDTVGGGHSLIVDETELVEDGNYLRFTLSSSTSLKATGDGVPMNISVDTSTMVVNVTTKTVLPNITLLNQPRWGVDKSKSAKAIHFKGDITEGATVKAVVEDVEDNESITYALYDADGGSANGFELTYKGWLPWSLKGGDEAAFRFKSSKGEYTLSGGNFITGSPETDEETGELTFEGVRYNYNALEYVTVTSSGAFSLNNTDYEGWGTALEDFHLNSSALSNSSTLNVNGVNFSLLDVDGNKNNGRELVNSGWYKYTATDEDGGLEDNMTFVNSTAKFTITGSSIVDKCINGKTSIVSREPSCDAPQDNLPDGLTFTNSTTSKPTVTFVFDTKEMDFRDDGITIIGPSSWAGKNSVEVKNYDSTSNYATQASIFYTLEINTDKEADNSSSATYYTLKAVESESTNPQLPAEGSWTSGYDIDELINYDSAAGMSDGGLEEILDVKPLAGTDEFNVSTLFDGQTEGIQSTDALTYSARHRQKK